MTRVVAFIDGFNLYHSISELNSTDQLKWLNLKTLCNCFVKNKSETITDILYFTALASWNPDKEKRHKIYIKALRTAGITPVYGKFKRVEKTCRICHKRYRTHEEKMTDINIAIKLFEFALQDKFDSAFIISGDSDLIPSVQAVQKLYPTKNIGILFPPNRTSLELRNIADFHMKIKMKHLMSSQFSQKIVISKSESIECPSEWV